MAVKNTGTGLIHALSSFVQRQGLQPQRHQSMSKSYYFQSIFVICLCLCRAFNEILKADHAKFSVGEEYVIGDTVADKWQ